MPKAKAIGGIFDERISPDLIEPGTTFEYPNSYQWTLDSLVAGGTVEMLPDEPPEPTPTTETESELEPEVKPTRTTKKTDV